jgi:hypothetical protein
MVESRGAATARQVSDESGAIELDLVANAPHLVDVRKGKRNL